MTKPAPPIVLAGLADLDIVPGKVPPFNAFLGALRKQLERLVDHTEAEVL